MIHEKIFLREGEEDITLTTYIADERRTPTAVANSSKPV